MIFVLRLQQGLVYGSVTSPPILLLFTSSLRSRATFWRLDGLVRFLPYGGEQALLITVRRRRRRSGDGRRRLNRSSMFHNGDILSLLRTNNALFAGSNVLCSRSRRMLDDHSKKHNQPFKLKLYSAPL